MTMQTTRNVHDAMNTCDGLHVVRAIACFPEHLALMTEAAPGDTLRAYLERKAQWWGARNEPELFDVARRAGEWIRAFQKTGSDGRRIQLEEIREYIDVRLRRLTAAPSRPLLRVRPQQGARARSAVSAYPRRTSRPSTCMATLRSATSSSTTGVSRCWIWQWPAAERDFTI